MTFRLALPIAAVAVVLSCPIAGWSAEKDAAAPDQENNYYWQGTQLYNLGRLGEAFESFEKAIQRKQNAKESEAYLMQIRQEIVNNAKNRSKETVSVGGNNPDSALNVVYVEKGYVRVLIQAKFLFDENTTTFKAGAMDVLNKVASIVQNKDANRVEVTLIDELDPLLKAKDIDAERALAVFALLNFKRLDAATPS